MDAHKIARVCCEANRAICEANGDLSQVPWEAAAEWQQTSIVDGVVFVLSHPDATPADQHEAWMAARLHDGWAWGQVKDAAMKKHPCLVPYDHLPVEQRVKDHVFRALVHALKDA